jgi:F-type H+-transporting ATPase subunit epsilon
MRVAIYSLQKMLYEGEANAVNAKTLMGEITVLDHHQPLISMLAEGALRVTDVNDGEKWFDVKSGFLEVEPGNSVRLLVETV